MLATDEARQVAGALVIGAIALELVDAQIGVRPIGQAHAGTRARDFFHGDHVGQVAHVGAAIGLGGGDAQNAQVTHLAPQVHGELIVGIDGCGTRRNFGLRKVANRIA